MRVMRFYPQAWSLRTPFVIARGERTEASVIGQINNVLHGIEQGISRDVLLQLLPAGAARNAIDSALWDLERQAAGKMLAEYAGVALPARQCWDRGARLLKIKLDDNLLTERMVAIRAAVLQATLIVDANESWQPKGLATCYQLLADLGVAMLEQPLPAEHNAALQHFIHPLPICADESCHTRDQLATLQGSYEMINIRLDKTGGLTEALLLAPQARDRGFAIMLGCYALYLARGHARGLIAVGAGDNQPAVCRPGGGVIKQRRAQHRSTIGFS